MKNTILFSMFLLLGLLQSCKKDVEDRWIIKDDVANPSVTINDISKDYYNEALELKNFQEKYPWFQGTVSDEDFAARRKDPDEQKIYKESAAKIDLKKLSGQLSTLFGRIQYFFPDFKTPTVFTFSSATQMAEDPIIYDPKSNFLFIDISGFLGTNNVHYKGKELYLQKSMNLENLLPKISENIAIRLVPYSKTNQKFLDQMVYSGKTMILQDAFLPETPDHLKIHYTKDQYEWAKANEVNIWDYFVEGDMLFSADTRMMERFINPAPFSKFYTEIDNESSPQIGVFMGWQICKKFLAEKSDISLEKFIDMDATDIFNQSAYKPK